LHSETRRLHQVFQPLLYLQYKLFIFSFSEFRYNKLSREIRELGKQVKELDPKDPFRTETSASILEKLYACNLNLNTKFETIFVY